MKYYKQFHHWPYVHLIALLCGCFCLGLIFVWHDPSVKVGFFACAMFVFFVTWILWKGREHYLEINRDWIVHHGFKRWRLKRIDLVRVEHGRKSWVEERDLYFKVHTFDREYHVDGGFLINEQRVEELTRAMQGTADSVRS